MAQGQKVKSHWSSDSEESILAIELTVFKIRFSQERFINMSSLYPDLTTENMESQNFTYNPQQAQRSDPQSTGE